MAVSTGSSGTTPLTIDVIDEGPSQARVRLGGQLDLTNVQKFDAEVHEQEARRLKQLVVDLSGLRFVDSAGIASLLRLTERAGETSSELRFTHGPDCLERVLQISGLTEILPFDA